ncbi:MAG: hypothetical protein KBT68_05770 [bacterium]|nr:hypothetical protein [Candidatus Colisoma equi]
MSREDGAGGASCWIGGADKGAAARPDDHPVDRVLSRLCLSCPCGTAFVRAGCADGAWSCDCSECAGGTPPCRTEDSVISRPRESAGRRVRIILFKRNVYHNNCGVLYPLDDFHELSKAKVGDDCSFALHIESAEDLQRKASAPQPKKKAVFQPKPVKDDFLAKLRLHRKRYGW